jgi:hypothetical protein
LENIEAARNIANKIATNLPFLRFIFLLLVVAVVSRKLKAHLDQGLHLGPFLLFPAKIVLRKSQKEHIAMEALSYQRFGGMVKEFQGRCLV